MSPTTYWGGDFAKLADAYLRDVQREMEAVDERLSRTRNDRQALEARSAQAEEALGKLLLPRFEPELVRGTVRWAGEQFRTEEILQEHDDEKALLRERLRDVENSPTFRRRDELIHPVTGSLTLAIADEEGVLAPLTSILERAQHPRLERLLESGYDTAAYDVPWWRMSYYDDWKAGDEIVERFGEHARFAEIAEKVQEVRKMAAAVEEKLRGLQAQRSNVAMVVAEHAYIEEALRTLDERHLQKTRARLVDSVMGLLPSKMRKRFPQDLEVAQAVKRVSGLRAQRRYLDALEQQMLLTREQLVREQGKAQRDSVKFRRSKYAGTRFSEEERQRRFPDRRSKWERFRARYDRAYAQVVSFNRYERANFATNFLWWDVMTDGRLDGDFIPEVQKHRSVHGGRSRSRRDDDFESAAAAVVARDGYSGGFVDPS